MDDGWFRHGNKLWRESEEGNVESCLFPMADHGRWSHEERSYMHSMYMCGTHKTYVMVNFSSNVGVDIPSCTQALQPLSFHWSCPILLTFSLHSIRMVLFSKSCLDQILVGLYFMGVLNVLAAEGDGDKGTVYISHTMSLKVHVQVVQVNCSTSWLNHSWTMSFRLVPM